MASVYEKASKWYLRWKGPDGRWRDQVSTARSKTEARRLAGELSGALRGSASAWSRCQPIRA